MIALRPLRKRESSTIVRLADEIFGEGYMSVDDVDDKFAGFTNTELWDEEDFDNTGFSLGLIETVVVHPEYRGMRLGDTLVSAACAQIIEVYATTWSDTGLCYIGSALKRQGFEVKQEFPKHWAEDPPSYTSLPIGGKYEVRGKLPCLNKHPKPQSKASA